MVLYSNYTQVITKILSLSEVHELVKEKNENL